MHDLSFSRAGCWRTAQQRKPAPPVPDTGVHHTSVVDETAKLGRELRVGLEAIVGDGVVLQAGVRINAGASIGDGSVLHANAVVRERRRLGRGVILNQNVSIGADGFGVPAGGGRQALGEVAASEHRHSPRRCGDRRQLLRGPRRVRDEGRG